MLAKADGRKCSAVEVEVKRGTVGGEKEHDENEFGMNGRRRMEEWKEGEEWSRR